MLLSFDSTWVHSPIDDRIYIHVWIAAKMVETFECRALKDPAKCKTALELWAWLIFFGGPSSEIRHKLGPKYNLLINLKCIGQKLLAINLSCRQEDEKGTEISSGFSAVFPLSVGQPQRVHKFRPNFQVQIANPNTSSPNCRCGCCVKL